MNFCDNCNVAFESERCPACGTKKTRQVKDDDFCFLLEDNTLHCEVLMGVLETNDIPYSAMPYGSGVESYIGKSLSNYRIYVPYSSFDKARGILRDMEAQKTEEWRGQLLDNVKSFNIPPKMEKKLRKKLKLPNETNFIDFCVDIVKSANRIVDQSAYADGWRYVYCYADDISITFNSLSFEILAVRKKNA